MTDQTAPDLPPCPYCGGEQADAGPPIGSYCLTDGCAITAARSLFRKSEPERTYTETEVKAAVAAALGKAALVPMDRLAEGKSVAPANVSAAIQRLITPDALAALDRGKAEARREERERIKAEFTAHPWSWNKREIHAKIDAAAIRAEAEKPS